MIIAKNSFKKLCQMRKKNWSAPAIISAFILICMIIVYSFETIGLLNKERNLDVRLSNPESLIKTSYKDLKDIYSDKFVSHLINPINEENLHLKKDFVLNKINIHSKKSKEIYIEKINKILIEGAISQMRFENSIFNNTQSYNADSNNSKNNNFASDLNGKKFYCGCPLDYFVRNSNSQKSEGDALKNYLSMILNSNERRKLANNENENNDILYFDM